MVDKRLNAAVYAEPDGKTAMQEISYRISAYRDPDSMAKRVLRLELACQDMVSLLGNCTGNDAFLDGMRHKLIEKYRDINNI